MKVSKNWLKDFVDLKVSMEELVKLLSLRTIGLKEIADEYIELDMKGYNRADLLSMRGIGQEVAAITDSKIKFAETDPTDYAWVKNQLPKTPVKIIEEDLSPVQAVAKIEGLKVGPSSKEWVDKLNASGMRSVNNIADITNLIMLEYGHPLHAFDASTVDKDTIIVRRAKNGEEIITLDGKLRKLTSEDIVLADENKALDVAGVMGGKDTEIKDSTYTILLSASLFNPTMVRKTVTRLKLGSEASKRFYHGLTKQRLLQAFNAAIKMFEDLGGKLTAVTLIGDFEDKVTQINLTQKKINSLIGVDIPAEQIETSLQNLGFKVQPLGSDLQGRTLQDWKVTVPYWRLDVNIEEDLIEEVARLYGYEKIPAKELEKNLLPEDNIDQYLPNLIYDLKKALSDAGLTEVQTYSFYSSKTISDLEININNLVKILNPISSETEYLKDFMWPNLIEVIGKNLKNGFDDIAIFEIGKVYSPKIGEMPSENYRLSIALVNETDNPVQELNQIFTNLNMQKKTGKLENKKYFHPTRFSPVIAEVHPRILHKFGVETRVAVVELDLF